MLLTKRELPILVVNLIYIPIFTVIALRRTNYEFLLYVVVIILAGLWVVWKQRRVQFGLPILWGLTVWGLLHMCGGNLSMSDGHILYSQVLIPIWPAQEILRYDHLVHTFGFGVSTLICYHLLVPLLRPDGNHGGVLWLLVVLMGAGVGAVNEIVEFVTVLIFTETGVGGYFNTLWDLVFNMIGGTIAVTYLAWKRRRPATARS